MAVGFGRWLRDTNGLGGPIFFFRFDRYLPLAQVCDRVGPTFNAEIRRQLGLDWHQLNPPQRRDVALQILRRVPCLMIWDNFETVRGSSEDAEGAWTDPERAELARFLSDLRGGATRVLITSRRDEDWLGPVYYPCDLRGLPLAEAQELALRVLRRAGLDQAEIRALPQYNDLLRYLRGNPLAIQVVVPELKRTTPAALLAELQSGEATLGEDDPREGRERSLTASLSYRLDGLPAGHRERLGILALFQGFVVADNLAVISGQDGAPQPLAGLEREAWIEVLDSAADAGLLQRVGDGKYSVHPALPYFFQRLFREVFSDAAGWPERAYTAAYAAYGAWLTRAFARNAEGAMALMRTEEANLLNALRIARRCARWDEVDGALYGLHRLFTTQGRWEEWERLLDAVAPEVTDDEGVPVVGAEYLWRALLARRSDLLLYRHDYAGAEAIYRRLMEHCEATGDDGNASVSAHQLGVIAQERREFDEAERWYRRGLAIDERIGDEHGQAISLLQLGMIAQERRKFDEAEQRYRQSLAIRERIGDEQGQASTLHQLGTIAHQHRRFDEAERWYRQSLAIKERIGDEHGQAITLHGLGMIAGQRRQFDEAERWYRQGLAIEERIGDEQGQAQTFHQLGIIAHERRAFGEAERWYRQSLAIEERIGNEHGQAQTLHQLGRIAEERGDTGEALAFYERAAAIFTRLDDPHSLGVVRASMERVRGHGGDPGAAATP